MSYAAHRTYPAKVQNPEPLEPPQPIVVMNCSQDELAQTEARQTVLRAGAKRTEIVRNPMTGGLTCLGYAQ